MFDADQPEPKELQRGTTPGAPDYMAALEYANKQALAPAEPEVAQPQPGPQHEP